MSAGAPWSVKGIDPKAREVAKDLARRSGMTLGEWLNHVILEDDLPEDVTAEGQFAGRRLAPEGLRQEGPRLTAVPASPDLARIAFALDRLTDRIEASETRTGLAINGVEHSVRQALARIETAEREQHAQTTRLEGLLAESSAQHGYVGERLRRLEAEPAGPRSAEALRALDARIARVEPEAIVETVLQRLGDRVAMAEARTAAALEELKRSLGGLDRRVGAVERGAGQQAELKFEALAQVLAHQVEAVRAEVAEKLQASAGPEIEARLAQMADHVQAAERRAQHAVEEMGRQVLAMAEAVGKKLSDVDQRGAEAIDQVGTEVARIAGAVELRLARSEQTQAEAFDRLGAEIARVTDVFAQRLSETEGRAGVALDDLDGQAAILARRVGEPAVGPITDVEADRQTEALLAEARQRFALRPEPEAEPPAPEPEAPAAAAFGPELFSRAEIEGEAEPPRPAPVDAPWRRLDLDVPDADIPEIFAPIAESDDDDLFEPESAMSSGPQLSTREVIERARAAARAQQDAGTETPAPVSAKAETRAATGRLFQGFPGARPRKPQPTTALTTALMIAGGAAFLSVGAAGLTLMQGESKQAQQAELSPLGDHPRAAMALAPAALTHDETTGSLVAPVFEKVRADVEAGVPGAISSLKSLANAGHAQAQVYLAQLYDTGEAGLPRDLAEARRLTRLAAEAGDTKAMHNLGVYYFRGEGGPQDLTSAAEWFRRAAGAGVVESQYNLGLLYQSGNGVPKDLVAARHWFRQAAAKGDEEARQALAALTPKPSPRPQIAPTRWVSPYPHAASPLAEPAAGARPAPSMNVRQTQLILTRLGYYAGPADGRASDAYRTALSDYQNAQSPGPHPYVPER